MIIFVAVLCFLASSCSARPNIDTVPQNVVTVPTNCPEGQAWVNGACRDIWRATAAPANLITVPPNCPSGQEYINGQCRDVWIKTLIEQSNLREILSDSAESAPQNVVITPPNCLPGQQWINGYCRDVWRSGENTKNVITVPTNCPSGQEYVNGQCREVWRSFQNLNNDLKIAYKGGEMENEELVNPSDANRNVISVPNQCPAGYMPDALGNCRPILF